VSVLYNLDFYVLSVLWLLGIPVGLYAFVHALMQRSDAFTAEKLSKPVWCAITGVGLAILAISTSGPYSFLWLVGIIAVLIYIVDVRPRVIEIQQGPRW
jgi:beta-lactamase regulating signal transducer with metallopeptidase domain